MKIACVSVIRNAGQRIEEWIAYHLAIGFDAVVILDNGSDDGTLERARRFAPAFDVRVYRWPRKGKQFQRMGFEIAAALLRREFEWAAFMDDDEFIAPAEGRDLKGFLASLPKGVDGVLMPWAFFGSNGHDRRPEGLVIANYPRRGSLHTMLKSIVRLSSYYHCVDAHYFMVKGIYTDLAGRLSVRPGKHLDYQPDPSGGMLNHYFSRSREEYEQKIQRGYAEVKLNPKKHPPRGWDEFDHYDQNDIEDLTAARQADRVRAIIAEARAQTVPPPGDLVNLQRGLFQRIAYLVVRRWHKLVSRRWRSAHLPKVAPGSYLPGYGNGRNA